MEPLVDAEVGGVGPYAVRSLCAIQRGDFPTFMGRTDQPHKPYIWVGYRGGLGVSFSSCDEFGIDGLSVVEPSVVHHFPLRSITSIKELPERGIKRDAILDIAFTLEIPEFRKTLKTPTTYAMPSAPSAQPP